MKKILATVVTSICMAAACCSGIVNAEITTATTVMSSPRGGFIYEGVSYQVSDVLENNVLVGTHFLENQEYPWARFEMSELYSTEQNVELIPPCELTLDIITEMRLSKVGDMQFENIARVDYNMNGVLDLCDIAQAVLLYKSVPVHTTEMSYDNFIQLFNWYSVDCNQSDFIIFFDDTPEEIIITSTPATTTTATTEPTTTTPVTTTTIPVTTTTISVTTTTTPATTTPVTITTTPATTTTIPVTTTTTPATTTPVTTTTTPITTTVSEPIDWVPPTVEEVAEKNEGRKIDQDIYNQLIDAARIYKIDKYEIKYQSDISVAGSLFIPNAEFTSMQGIPAIDVWQLMDQSWFRAAKELELDSEDQWYIDQFQELAWVPKTYGTVSVFAHKISVIGKDFSLYGWKWVLIPLDTELPTIDTLTESLPWISYTSSEDEIPQDGDNPTTGEPSEITEDDIQVGKNPYFPDQPTIIIIE